MMLPVSYHGSLDETIPAAAVAGVNSLKLEQSGADGEVQLNWTERWIRNIYR